MNANKSICCNHNCNQGRDCPLRNKEMNNEPVAWMETYCGKPNNLVWSVKEAETIHPYGVIPLYTHPVKELTDEEILECWNETHPAVVCLNAELPLFARAILRKAQEK